MESLGSLATDLQNETTEKESSESPASICPSHGTIRHIERVNLCGQSIQLGTGCLQCDEAATKEAEHRDRQRRDSAFARAQDAAGIPSRYRSATIGPFPIAAAGQKEVLQVAEQFARTSGSDSTGLILLGKVGTGKTHVACAILNGVLRLDRTGLFLTTAQAIRRIKESWGREPEKTERQAYNILFAPTVLVLDEVGVQRGSDSELLILDEVINERYNRRRPTLLISNLPMKEFTALLGDRVVDRFREGGQVLVFDWPSLRPRIRETV